MHVRARLAVAQQNEQHASQCNHGGADKRPHGIRADCFRPLLAAPSRPGGGAQRFGGAQRSGDAGGDGEKSGGEKQMTARQGGRRLGRNPADGQQGGRPHGEAQDPRHCGVRHVKGGAPRRGVKGEAVSSFEKPNGHKNGREGEKDNRRREFRLEPALNFRGVAIKERREGR